MKKVSKVIDVLFIIVTLISLYEYNFIRGMFSWILSFGLIVLFGIIQIIFSLLNKSYYKALLVLLLVVSICSGYIAFL